MAEFLIYDKDHWMDVLTLSEINAYKERAADNYVKWRDTKIALTTEQIDDILRPLIQKAKKDWMTKHTEVLNMTQGDIEAKCEEARVRFQTKYDGRYQRGDTVEERPDGFFSKTLKGDLSKWPFRIVCVPGQKVSEAYAKPLMDGEIMLKRRRFSISTGRGQKSSTVSSINDLTITDKNG